jgi:hypothetical protein
LKKLIEIYGADTDDIFRILLGAVDSYAAVRRPVWGPMPRAGRIPWHHDAFYLKNVLAAAPRTGKPLSFENDDAPAIEFLSDVLKRSPEAVAGAFRVRQKRARP